MGYLSVYRYLHKFQQFQRLSLSTQVRSFRRIIQMANDLPFVYRLNVQFLVVLIATFKLPSYVATHLFTVLMLFFRSVDKASK